MFVTFFKKQLIDESNLRLLWFSLPLLQKIGSENSRNPLNHLDAKPKAIVT